MMMEICVIDHENRQNPPLLIPETFSPVPDVQYELVGAVLVRPGHFTCIVKYKTQFFLLDDLNNDCEAFNCFTGALTNNHMIIQDHHLTSPNEDGIHILLYARQTDENVSRVVFNSVDGVNEETSTANDDAQQQGVINPTDCVNEVLQTFSDDVHVTSSKPKLISIEKSQTKASMSNW